jgi:L-lactate dehydrogenase complex protein LldG
MDNPEEITGRKRFMEKDVIHEVMTQKAQAVGTVVQQVDSVPQALSYVIELAAQKKVETLVCPGLEQADRNKMEQLCRENELTLLSSPLRDSADNIDICLTWADAGIADTGTLMIKSDSEEIRIGTMLSTIHVAMLPVTKIVKDTAALEPDLDSILKTPSASYTAFITGPSRTADIERVLAVGVHGPVELHLLLIGENQVTEK